MCDRLQPRLGKTYSLRGWQRRRLVPLQYTDRERRKLVAGVLITLNELLKRLPGISGAASSIAPVSKKTAALRKVGRERSLA